MPQQERCQLKNEACEEGNLNLPRWRSRTCPLRRESPLHKNRESKDGEKSRQIQYRELPNAMQVAAIRSDVVKVSIFPPFTDEIIQKIISAPILAGDRVCRRDTNQSQGRKPTTRRPRFHLRRSRKGPFALHAPRKTSAAHHLRLILCALCREIPFLRVCGSLFRRNS